MLKKIEKDEIFEKMVSGVRDEFKTPTNHAPARKRPALGKGLSSLMGLSEVSVEPEKGKQEAVEPDKASKIEPETPENVVREVEAPALVEDSAELGFCYLSVSKVIANPNQPRKRFEEEELASLAASIRESGLIQPVVVRPVAEGVFEIVAGERRFRAANLAGLDQVPVIVRELDEQETLELSIVENVQRSDLSPLEEAAAYKRLADEFGLSQGEIAETVGKDRASIANTMRLLGLEPEVQDLIDRGQISAGHGRALLMKEAGKERLLLALKVVKEALSVRETERLAKKVIKESEPKKPSPHSKELESTLRRALGTKVKVKLSPSGAGEIKLSFFSSEELDGLLDKLTTVRR